MPKNTNKTKNTGTIFGLATDFVIEKYQAISMKFKIRISQLITTVLLKQQSLNQLRHSFTHIILASVLTDSLFFYCNTLFSLMINWLNW